MSLSRLLSYGKMILLGCFAVAAVLYGTWTTTEFVMAYRELKRAHIFPTIVTAAGWHDFDRVRIQELSEEAPFASFTRENSAYITLAEGERSNTVEVPPVDAQPSDPEASDETDMLDDDTAADAPGGSESDGGNGDEEGGASEPAADAVLDDAASAAPAVSEPAPVPAPAATPEVNDAPTSFLQQVIALTAEHMRARATWVLTNIAQTAFATSTGSGDESAGAEQPALVEEVVDDVTDDVRTDTVPETEPEVEPAVSAESVDAASDTAPLDATTTDPLGDSGDGDDVGTEAEDGTEVPSASAGTSVQTYSQPPQADAFASCAVSGGTCYILELSGFRIDGSLSQKTFKEAELNFSFANLTGEGALVDDKLIVRYFHEGRWRSAGEIYLNKEISNGSNGGYFTSTLDDIEDWDDLADVKVVIEYEHASGKSAELYMDAVWIDTVYQEPAQDVFDGETDEPDDVGENVMFELANGGIETPTLVLSNGDRILFPYTDDVDEDQLALYADKESYRGMRGADESVAYVSVTNTTDYADTFRLLAAFPNGNGAIREIAQYLRNVPGETEEPLYEDVTYLCEGGWEKEVKSQKSKVKSASQDSESEEQGTGEEREKEKDEIETERSKTENGEQTVSATSTGELTAEATSTGGEVKSQKSEVKSASQKSESVEQTARADEEVDNTEVITTDETENEKLETKNDAATYVCAATGQVEPCASLSETGENCLVPHVSVGVEKGRTYASAWVPVDVSSAPQDESGVITSMPPGYEIGAATANGFEILPDQTVYFRITFDASAMKKGRQFVLYAKGESLFGDLDSALLRDAMLLSEGGDADISAKTKKMRAQINKRLSSRTDFDGDEMPEFRFKFSSQKPFLSRMAYRMLNKKTFAVERARLHRMDAADEDIPVEIEYAANGEWTLAFKKRPRAFRPGKYAVELTITEGKETYTDSVDFYWGVLAINSNKSLYEPNEVADLSLAVLDDNGSTICDAELHLTIADPTGASHDVPIHPSGVCGPDNVVDVPDYSAEFAIDSQVGTYTMTLEEYDAEGNVIHRITDAFQVAENVAFVVERVGPTRIYPKAPYGMDIAVTARHDFSGTVTEAIPVGTLLLEKDGGSLSQYGDALRLSWTVNLAAGETKHFRYTFDAPDRSPYLYVFGPLEMRQESSVVFTELRTWKVASDALGTYVEKSVEWSPTTAAAWQTKDLSGSPFNVPAGAVVEIAIVNSNAGNERMGGVRHASSSLSRIFDIHEAELQGVTETIMHVQTSATSSIQTYAENTTDISFVLLGYWTSGYYVERFQQIDPGIVNATWGNINLSSYGVADGNVAEMVLGNWNIGAEYNGGVRQLGSSLNRYANIHESESNGINTATMLVKASTTNATIQGYAQSEGANGADIDYWLAGYWSVNPTGLDYTERFDDLSGPTTTSVWSDRALDSYGVPPTGIASILFGNAVSGTASLLLGVRTNGSTIDRTQNLHDAESGGWDIGSTHVVAGSDASSTIEYLTEDTANDVFRLLGYWSAGNYPPNTPTLYDIPFESEKTGTSTPKFRFSATDPDGTSSIVYQIQWDDDAVLDDAPLGDESSDTDAGFANITTPADTSPFNEGDSVEYTIQSSLVSGTTYYWRARATDVSGSNVPSEWTEVKSFTYVANTSPARWFQTEDSQFEQGTLSNTETYGSNAVRIVTSAPTGAIIAYGEGTVQTPRYRTWSGTAWGAEASAQSVGGTIQWMRMAAGTTRNEYVLGTQDALSDVNVQVYDGDAGTWGDLQEVTATVANTNRRGFDVAYETTSGDALVVYCDGDADPAYRVWDGSSWSAATTINLASANNCEWIQLASDPTSDEIVLAARDTGAQYEVQVWDGSAWGNSQTLGSMNQPQHEGIAVSYEESGEQVVVTVSNGTNPSFYWTAWNGAEWSVPTTEALNDDFEWGIIKRDSGSDAMALCYIDEDSDLGFVRWDGDAWQTYQEFDTGGNNDATSGTPEGRPISCEFETTSGRDGYIMLPYSDTAAARYRYWDGATLSAETSISTIEDSWTVGSVRTGDGKILSYFHDDVNSRYDFSYWNGSSWATAQTLENSASVTATPFLEPITMAAQKYQSQSGTITSDPVSFSLVPGQQTWGEALWNTTEPAGTNVTMQVMYGSSCSTLVPDGVLSGNSTGFDIAASPLDLSGISTTTYSQLCLRATLDSTTQSTPTLNDWSISWVRRPYLTQAQYRWYANAASSTVSDVWPSGGDEIGENTAIPSAYAPAPGNVLRLRLGILDENVGLSSSNLSLRLQYAEGATCGSTMAWKDVGEMGSTTAAWRGYANTISTGNWYNASWAHRVPITIDADYVDATLTNFPVYVDLSDLGSGFWSSVQDGGADIRITTDDGMTEVAREVVTAATGSQTGELYFKAGSLSSTTDTTFYIYYGNSSASDYADSDTYGANNVWTNSFAGVWHFNDETSTTIKDSTSGNYTGTKGASTAAPTQVSSPIGYAQACDGNDYIEFGDVLDAGTNNWTIETWFRPTAAGTINGSILYNKENRYEASAGGGSHTYAWQPHWNWDGGTSFAITTNNWHYGVVAYDHTNQIMYRNGTQVYSRAQTGDIGTNSEQLQFCARGNTTHSSFFTGQLDEIRMSSTNRSVDWIAATYDNMYTPGSFYSFGTAENVEGGDGDGMTLFSTVLSSSDIAQSYEAENDSVLNPRALAVNEQGEWDWVLQHNASSSASYCFRTVTSDGEVLNAYDVYPGLVTNSRPNVPTQEAPFDNERLASTTPWFEFAAEDPDGDDVTYQIQIDDTYDFSSAVVDRNSQTNFSEFTNMTTPSDKDPFSSGQSIKFIPTTALNNGTTYYWRVRAKDRTKSNEWSEWSDVQSVTIDTSTSVATWYQTTLYQFATNDLEETEATSTNEIVLTPPQTAGTSTSQAIDFDWGTTGNAWGELSWTDTETGGIILYHIEYWTGSAWALIPDSALAGNATGFGTSPISLLSIDPSTYNQIRLRANFTQVSATPRLSDWTITWGLAVEQPTQYALFDNEKVGTTTPTFEFVSSDPQGNDLVYEISWSTSPQFTSSTTRISSTHAGFTNTVNGGDTSPFTHGERINFTVQSGDALTNGQTYWWRVRAIDPSGGNTWSVWSATRSFTVDTSVTVSTWFQTTDDQFTTDTLNDIEITGSGSTRVTTTNREAFMAYAEGTAQVPRFRLWNGVSWGAEQSALSVGDTIRFVESAAAPTRDEYMIVTMGSTGVMDAQVYNGTTDTAGNSVEMSYATNMLRRGFDVAYETSSGDALVVGCYGTEATYRVWNGTSWTASSTITLAVSGNCEWVKLASDPTSDEIILVVRDTTAGAVDYEALVWNGSSWGNSSTFGSQATAANEGIAVEYEESGGQAIVAVSNGANNNFIWNAWNGSSWSGTATVTMGNDFAGGRIVHDSGSDEMAMCYTDIDNDLGFIEWNGSAWGTYAEFEANGNSFNGRPISCEYETTTGRDNYVMIPYSDSAQMESVYWNGTALSSATVLVADSDSWEVRTARTGDGTILAVAYDDAYTDYDFFSWDGSSWATQVIELNAITTLTPRTVPLDIVARRYPSFNSGSVVSTAIDFDDGTGPKWGSITWNDTTPGSSDITYQVEYLSAPDTWELIPDAALPYNSVGTSTGPFSLASVNRTTYNQIRLKANFACVSGQCPNLNDWTLTWSEGISVSGTIQEYDQSTNVLSGTVAIAVNGVVQSGKTGTITNGTWTIPNITAFTGDIITIFVDGAVGADRAVGVTEYTSEGSDITGMVLYERHLTLGSDDAPTLTNADIGQYDATDDADVFHDVDAGNDLTVCPVADTGCFGAELWIKNGTTYRPDSASSGGVTTHGIEINGTLVADGNTITVNGSWDNNGIFTANTSTVLFAATSTTETIDSTTATTSSFNNVTFGTAGAATWNLASAFDVNGNLTLSYGTLSQGANVLTMAGNLTINSNGHFTKGSATTTFDGTGTSSWTDSASSKQDMGNVVIDGTTKIIMLGAGAKATNITIGADDTLDVNNNYPLEVTGNWTNTNVFTPRYGTVTFSATDVAHTITPGNSSFYNITFNGVGGNWAFSGSAVNVTNDFTIANGDVTLLSGTLGTTTIGGSFANTGGTFAHNNGVVLMTSSAAKTIQAGSSSFRDLTFNGTGSWSFVGANATTTRHFTITQGSVTLPTGVLGVGGSFMNNGGSFTAGSGTVYFSSSVLGNIVRTGASNFNNVQFYSTASGGWYNGAWLKRKMVTIESDYIDADLTNFPVYVDLSSMGASFFSDINSDGGDIRVTASDGITEVPREVVGVSTSGHTGELYFRASSVSASTDTTFYIYYDNASASNYAASDTYGTNNVWTNGFGGVWHMHNALSTTVGDSTSGNYTGTKGGGAAAPTQVAARFGYAQYCDGADYIDLGDVLDAGTNNFTVETWYQPTAVGTAESGILYNKENMYEAAAGGNVHRYAWMPSWAWYGGSTFTTTVNNWYYAAVTYDKVNQIMYKDGAQVYSRAQTGNIGSNTARLQFCARGDTGHSSFFTGNIDEMRISTTNRSAEWIAATHDNMAATSTFYTVASAEDYGDWRFSDASDTVTGNFTVSGGAVVLPSGTLSVGGSWNTTSGTFGNNSGTVTFNSTDTGETITAGSSPFYNLTINSGSGGWTMTGNTTVSNAATLTAASNFTVNSGVTFTVNGVFTNNVGGAATTWTGSTLALDSNTTYSINSKTSTGDTYGTLNVGADTDIRMWNSAADTYTVDSLGSLFSQDHATAGTPVDGALYIWGQYVGTGTEYWSYTTDFDGTDITSTPRVVNVRVASSTSITLSGGSAQLRLLGGVGATTTVQNQGVGAYSFAVTGGTVNAQYFAFRNLTAAGLSLSGTPTMSVFSDGDFELGVNGGSMITVASTTIDAAANQALQVQRMRFATSTGITSGYNVTESGDAASYWWFRNHVGNRAGENYDNDTGNPGDIRWDDSSITISVSGNVYANHGSTASSVCNGSTQVVRVVTSTGNTYNGSCAAGTGAYTISGVAFSGDVGITVFLNTNGGSRAVTVTKTPINNITGVDLYENVVALRHEDSAPITIADLARYDSSDDSDIFFTALTGTPNTLVVAPENELYVTTGKTFAPGGNVTLQSGGSGDARDGRLYIAANGVFTAAGTETHAIGGGWWMASGASFTPAQSTITFTATTTGKIINASSTVSFYDLAFTGVGGGWAVTSPVTTTVTHSLTPTAGTLSGTGDITVSAGGLTGAGTVAMTGGTVRVYGDATFGNTGSTAWQFNNLIFGDGTGTTTTKVGTGTTTIAGTLTIAAAQTLNAGTAAWVFTGGGEPLVETGLTATFNAQTAPVYFTGTSAVTVADATYYDVYFAPAAAGTPTYALRGGTLAARDFTVGGANPVIVTANTNDPSLDIAGNVTITAGSTLTASNVGVFTVGGSWTNSGTFTHNNREVTFDSSDSGETITAGVSPFYDITFTNGGGWSFIGNATTSHDLDLTDAASFTVPAGATLEVGGTFTNAVGGAATTWTDSTLYLNSATNYSINSTSTADTYGTLMVGANTDIRMWNSSAATTTVNSTGSLYSQDHASVDGALYIWGDYTRSAGADYWSYETDFDGEDISSTPRQVNVYIASSSAVTFSGGIFDIIGASGATTTIQNQGSGRYSFAVSGASTDTLYAQYYQFRNLDASGVNISGSPTITTLSDGDFELDIEGGTLMTVAGSAITQNPLKIFMRNRFAFGSGITTGYNVTTSGTSDTSWKFNLHYGGLDGETHDADPNGAADPGFIRWDDSSTAISISGHVYTDEGSTVNAAVCTGASNIRLMIQGGNTQTTSCDSGTGAYTFSSISFNPGDTLTVYIDGVSGHRAANVTVDPVSTISNMDLYDNRVIVRHEDTAPITIAQMAVYDSSDDADIPFTAVDAGSDTLTLPPETKLIVWDGKTFAPAGEVTLQSGGSGNAWDGTLELRSNAVFSAANTQTHSIGGNLTVGAGASISAASSTFAFTATTTGKTITLNGSSLFNMTFNGTGGNWAFAGANGVTTRNDFTVSAGTVTLSSATTTVGGSFQNTGGTFMHNNGTLSLTASSTGKTIRTSGSNLYNLIANNASGGWTFADTSATSSGSVTITAGALTLPTTNFSVGGSFLNYGTFTPGPGAVKFTAATAGKQIRAGSSQFYDLTFDGVGGEWTFVDTAATTTRNFTITNGSTTLPATALGVGGSFVNAGTFTSGTGLVNMYATSTGKNITAGASRFYNLFLNSASGGWTITGNATTTNNFTLAAASSFTLASGATLEVDGTFTNNVSGSATTWTGSTLYLNSGTSYTANTKTLDDAYGTLRVGANTDVRMWNSTATAITVDSSGSLYSQDHDNTAGRLYIWGDYVRSTGIDYWSYATDFDGAALGGSPRQVDVRIASSSSVTYSSGSTLRMLGIASATTTVQVQGTGRYDITFSGGTFYADYYAFRNLAASGLNFSGASAITAMNSGDFELDIDGGSMITVSPAAIDANASKIIAGVRFALGSGITSGYNVSVTSGTTNNFWTFTGTPTGYAGESYDNDGGDACGNIRWQNSSCLLVNQAHFRWRADDGGEGAPDSEWYSASWSKRKKVAITNPNTTGYTNLPVKITVTYDADMQSDFDDIRFTDSSGTTSLDYWIESYTPSTNAVVWVEVPTIYAEDSADLYMYYGNGSVADGSDGEATFPFFDGFEDGNLNAYVNNSDRSSRFEVSTDSEKHGTYGLDAGTSGDLYTTNGLYQTGSLTAQDNTIRFFQYVDGDDEDEPCTLFAVGGSGQNYAVCLDQYPEDSVIIAENVTSNDGSGTVLASKSVSFSSTAAWYEVVISWLDAGDTINVSVYNNAGSLFATTSASDSSRTSGGVGFSYWGQHGSWDTYTVKQYTASAPTAIFGEEQGSGGATWLEDLDTTYAGAHLNETVRLRFSIQNTGAQLTNQNFRLQYVQKGSALNCESVSGGYADVPVAASCGGSAACMTTSTHFTSLANTAALLPYPSWMSFTYGQIIEDPDNDTSAMTINTNVGTEVEYAIQLTSSATANSYCFRVTDAGGTGDLDSYAHVAEIVLAHAPTIENFSFNSATDIALTEGATTTIYATGTVEDLNGYEDILFATSTMYRSGVAGGAMCVNNVNNCYQISSSSCALENCSGATCDLSCSADVQYFAEPTDTGSTYASDVWRAIAYVEDATGLSDTATSSDVELLTLRALSVDLSEIAFGELDPGADTGIANVQTPLINTGNTEINIELSGTDLDGSMTSIPVNSQMYATSTFAYGSCSICNLLSGSATQVDVDLPKPTSTSTPITDDLYWGIGIPMNVRAEYYQGHNTFTAVGG